MSYKLLRRIWGVPCEEHRFIRCDRLFLKALANEPAEPHEAWMPTSDHVSESVSNPEYG
jgi:hypothetical protein